ncbi:calmodulin-binding protein 25-like [Macadamia integrifolia]|uniref:calmodulin-binding protein 25-like n=1 Tax=Macadamia integrifolia TaxID=60698 RepID=UPI001C4F3CD9|nr:calmodulin-binding protein 25-like [Macadamia integrifolia]
MASSDNLSSLVEPWAFRPFTDSWISDAFIRDTETLTKALQKSLSEESKTLTTDSNSALVQLLKSDPAPTPTSTMSGSDPETAPKQQQQNRRNNTIGTAGGKISKRKSRASKRSQTTFITADPANFRQMVQQVTGIGFCNPHVPVDATVVAPPVLKPEPQRLGNRLQSCLPTLDTSALLLDHHPQQQQQQHHHQQIVGPTQATLATGHVSFAPVADGGAGLEFDSFQSFPTLESWRVM